MIQDAAMVLPPKPFNFAALEIQVRKAGRRAFKEVAAAHPEEQLCAFALYSDDGAMTVCPSINTAQHLAAMQRQHPDEATYYKFATPEWKYEATGADAAFSAICLKVRTQALAFEGVSKADAKTLGPERRRAHLAAHDESCRTSQCDGRVEEGMSLVKRAVGRASRKRRRASEGRCCRAP